MIPSPSSTVMNGEPLKCWELLLLLVDECKFQLFFGLKWLSEKEGWEGWEGRRGKELGRIPWSCMVLT